jgi:hypothetical protein
MPHKQLQRTVNVGTRLERGVSVHAARWTLGRAEEVVKLAQETP